MVNNEARYWEDYSKGSSDNPRTTETAGAVRMPKGPKRLEQKLQHVQTVKLLDIEDPERGVDVKRTNSERATYALEHGLLPVIKDKGRRKYRVVETDGQGLLQIRYQTTAPEELVAISDEETIPFNYIDDPELKAELRGLIRDGEIRGTSSRVNLSDLNTLQ